MNKLVFIMSGLFFSLYSSVVSANEYFPTVESVIAHFYQPGTEGNAPWHKSSNNKEGGVSDYALCYNKQVSQQPLQYLLVMCPDMTKNTYANEQAPTDIYVLWQTAQGYLIQASQQDIEGTFQGVVKIGAGKWAVHTSTYAMNQGYEQSHDTLRVFIKNDFIPVIKWTSLQNNESSADPGDESAISDTEALENKLTVDNSQNDDDFYPLVVHSVGHRGKTKIDKIYRVIYTIDKGEYIVPDEVNEGY